MGHLRPGVLAWSGPPGARSRHDHRMQGLVAPARRRECGWSWQDSASLGGGIAVNLMDPDVAPCSGQQPHYGEGAVPTVTERVIRADLVVVGLRLPPREAVAQGTHRRLARPMIAPFRKGSEGKSSGCDDSRPAGLQGPAAAARSRSEARRQVGCWSPCTMSSTRTPYPSCALPDVSRTARQGDRDDRRSRGDGEASVVVAQAWDRPGIGGRGTGDRPRRRSRRQGPRALTAKRALVAVTG